MGARARAASKPKRCRPKRPAASPRRTSGGRVVEWIWALLDREARRNAGDPGPVLARRLSNAELDYTIRDLTGVDIRPTKEFPVDPANEAGFDNSGESLAMSPALLKKYLAAARAGRRPPRFQAGGVRLRSRAGGHRNRSRQVLRPADHRFLPAAPGRLRRLLLGCLAVSNTEAGLGKPNASVHEFAAEAGLSDKYLATVWRRARGDLAGEAVHSGSFRRSGESYRPTCRNKTRLGAIASGCAIWSSGCGRARGRGLARCEPGASRPAVSPSCCGGPGDWPRGGCCRPSESARSGT